MLARLALNARRSGGDTCTCELEFLVVVSDGTPLADVVVVLRCCCAVQDSPWIGELFRLTFFVAARICWEADSWHLGAPDAFFSGADSRSNYGLRCAGNTVAVLDVGHLH